MNRAGLKERSKASMSWARPSILLVSLVFLLITQTIYFIVNWDPDTWKAVANGNFEALSVLQDSGWVSLLVLILNLLLSVINAGYNKYCLLVSRNQHASFGTLFDCIPRAGRFIGLNLLTSIIVASPTIIAMLLVLISPFLALLAIPAAGVAIYLSLGYSQAVFLAVEYEDMPVTKCLTESLRLMQGRRGEYFVLAISFILWNILCMLIIPLIWVTPYIQVTYANYYNLITGRLPQKNEPPADEADGPGGNIDPDMWK